MTDCVIIYCTYPSFEEAERITRLLLESRLISCGNIMPAGQSFYWWNKKIESAQEVVVIYKTTAERFESVKDVVIKAHSYDVPCVLALAIKAGNEDFLKWIGVETAA